MRVGARRLRTQCAFLQVATLASLTEQQASLHKHLLQAKTNDGIVDGEAASLLASSNRLQAAQIVLTDGLATVQHEHDRVQACATALQHAAAHTQRGMFAFTPLCRAGRG
ncbi:hypothetical protein EON66_02260 [archaeon]|nr:MAG: hypothetical protein EON66_02260 [archaeon]